MKITHVISSISRNSGGTSTYLQSLLEVLPSSLKNTLICYDSYDNLELPDDVNLKMINDSKKRINGFSREFYITLNETNSDLMHINGFWEFTSFLASRVAQTKKIPYVFSPHGMLEKWPLEQNKFIKKIALRLYQNKDLRRAACIHATSNNELKTIRNNGFKNPIAMIPNGVNIVEFPISFPDKHNTTKKILFLSRIHVKKGIENLIDAWKLINTELKKDWIIEIVGNGDENYIQSLKDIIISENLSEQIEIKKPVFGIDKVKLFREASLFVLPTFSENFGIVIAEALASYTPVITTKGTPWEDLKKTNSGWWTDIGIEPLKKVLEQAIGSSDKTLIKMGVNGRKLIEDKYSMQSVAEQMLQLYQWILTKKNKPNFVDTI